MSCSLRAWHLSLPLNERPTQNIALGRCNQIQRALSPLSILTLKTVKLLLEATPAPRFVIIDMADYNVNEHEDEWPPPPEDSGDDDPSRAPFSDPIYQSFWPGDLTNTLSFFNSELGVDLSATPEVGQQGVGPSTGQSWSQSSHTRDVHFGQSWFDLSQGLDQSIQQPSQRLATGEQQYDEVSHVIEHGTSANDSRTDTYIFSGFQGSRIPRNGDIFAGMDTREVSPRAQPGDGAPLSSYSMNPSFDNTPPLGEYLGQTQYLPGPPGYSTPSGSLVHTSSTGITPLFGNAESGPRMAVTMPIQGYMGGPSNRAQPAARENPFFGRGSVVRTTNFACSEPTPGSNQSKEAGLHSLDAGGSAAASPNQLNDQKCFNLTNNHEQAKLAFTSNGDRPYWTPERQAWLKAIVADQQSVVGQIHGQGWNELANKFTSCGFSSLLTAYKIMMKVDMNRSSWHRDEIEVLSELMRKEADWAKITEEVAKRTVRPVRPLHCVKMFGLYRHAFKLTENQLRILTRREDRNLSSQEYTRLLEWKKEWEQWPAIHDNVSLFIERFASTYRIAYARVERAYATINIGQQDSMRTSTGDLGLLHSFSDPK